MAKVLICYFSKSGKTRKMAESIQAGLDSLEGIQTDLKKVRDTDMDDLLAADGILLGSPTYFGTMAAEMKGFIDRSLAVYGKLNGKVGGAFSSSMRVGGGNETTIMSLLQGLLIHGMLVQGVQKGDHYGPVAINSPDEGTCENCRNYGRLIGEVVLKLAG